MGLNTAASSNLDTGCTANMSAGNKKAIKVRAKHAYQRQNEDELSFQKGDIITVRHLVDLIWVAKKKSNFFTFVHTPSPLRLLSQD